MDVHFHSETLTMRQLRISGETESGDGCGLSGGARPPRNLMLGVRESTPASTPVCSGPILARLRGTARTSQIAGNYSDYSLN